MKTVIQLWDENVVSDYYFFPCVRAVNEQLGRGSARFSHFLGRHHTNHKGTEFMWVTFSEFQRATASPKGGEPSLTGAVMTTYFGKATTASITNSPRTNPPENHSISCILHVFTLVKWLHLCLCYNLSCSPAASGRYFLLLWPSVSCTWHLCLWNVVSCWHS